MVLSRILTLRGIRLSGAKICLFKSLPQNFNTSSFHHGVADICRKLKYPTPFACQPLVGGGDIIAEVPFQIIPGLHYGQWASSRSGWYPTAPEAVAAMWANGPIFTHDETSNVFRFQYQFDVGVNFLNLWYSYGIINAQGMRLPIESLNPDWRSDDVISFHMGFDSPIIPGAPTWTRLNFSGRSVGINSGPFEMQLNKNLCYQAPHEEVFYCDPIGFMYDDYLQLSEVQYFGAPGWFYTDMNAFNLRLIVRRGAGDFTIVWPDDVARLAACAAVVDTQSGLVVGPPIILS